MKKNIAVVGCGDWGRNLIRNFYGLNALGAICDINPSVLSSYKSKYPDLISFDSFDSLLENPSLNALVISTPAETHYPLAKQALLANKDVLVEKPLALSYEEADELVSLAEEKNKILMVGHILLYHPAVGELKRIINRGDLGRIYYIYSSRLNLGKFRKEENILWSFAPHDTSVILHLLDEMPESVKASGGNYLQPDVTDVTVTHLRFPSGVQAHIFVSWLHPYKEQKLVVIGEKKMAVFDDLNQKDRLVIYNHQIDWIKRFPVARPKNPTRVPIEEKEALRAECEHFLECVETRKPPLTDGHDGLRVLKIIEASQRSLQENGKAIDLREKRNKGFFVHKSSEIDEPCEIGEGTKIWHFSHVLKGCQIGKNCVLGQNVCVGPNVSIGNNVRIQNNVSVYEGVTLEDDVFCGPSVVFTNVVNPRSHWPRKDEFKKIHVARGASLGANSTILCGNNIGRYAFIGAGAFVDGDVPDYALVYGIPAKIQGWMCYCGVKLGLSSSPDTKENAECKTCGRKYRKEGWKVTEV